MENIDTTIAKLLFSYEVCHAFSTNSNEGSTEHVEKTAHSIINLIREQRKEVPNLLTGEHVHQHLQILSIPKCETTAQHPKTAWIPDYRNISVSFSFILIRVKIFIFGIHVKEIL